MKGNYTTRNHVRQTKTDGRKRIDAKSANIIKKIIITLTKNAMSKTNKNRANVHWATYLQLKSSQTRNALFVTIHEAKCACARRKIYDEFKIK